MNPNESQTINLAAGQVLSITAAAGTTGSVIRLSRTPGGGDPQSITAIAGANLTFGPYTQVERFDIICTAGAVTFTQAEQALDSDATLAANSDSRIPTQKAVKTYVDASVPAYDALTYQGVISSLATFPAADKGDYYKITAAGSIGGTGPTVAIGDIAICNTDSTSAGTYAEVGTKWDLIPATNIDYLSDLIAATAENDFIVAGASPFAWVKKTLDQTKAIIGLPTPTAENRFLVSGADPFTLAEKTLAQTLAILGRGAAGEYVLPEKTPVNAVAASGVVTFTGQPLAYVANVNASGVITVNGTPVAEEQMTVGAQIFTFKESGTELGNIVISATPAVQAANIVTSITRDLATVTAVAVDAVITVTAVAPGTAGNALAAVETATGIEWSSVTDNKLDGGVDEVLETLTIGTQAFKFVTLRGAVGSFEITSSDNTTTQAANAKAAINADVTNVTADNTDGVLTVTAAVKGVSGNLIALAESATGTAVSSVTGGKLDGGVDGTVGVVNELCADGSYLYHCTATNTIADANWRRIDLGSAYY
jgi:hypothetical protein